MWLVEGGDVTSVRTCETPDVRLAVVGDAWVTDDELRRALGDVRRGAWRDLTRWPGSYWVVAQHRDRTVVVSDLSGLRPVYHARKQGEVVWATEAKPLASLLDAGTDHQAIVNALVAPTLGDLVGTTTTFDRVQRVPGGHLLEIDGASANVRSYEPIGQGTRFLDGADLLRGALLDAVRVRVGNTGGLVSADFSGGLDSTTLGLLAARTGRTVLGVTLQDTASPNDDVPYAVLAAKSNPLVDHRIVTPDPAPALFDDLAEAPVTDQPCADAGRWARKWSYQRAVAEAGSVLHFVGAGGDLLLAAPSTSLAGLAVDGRHLALWRAAVAHARRRHLAAHEVFSAATRLARASYSDALTELADGITGTKSPAAKPVSWIRPSGVASWLTPDARRAIADTVSRLAEQAHDFEMSMSARRAWDEVREFGPYLTGLAQQAAALGNHLAAPFLDNEVIRAAMSVPVHEHLHPHRQKPLLAAAMRGLVPDRLLERRTKGSYNQAGYVGLTRNLSAIKDLLAGSELVANGLLDPEAITGDLALMSSGVPTRFAAMEALISAELWLTQQRHLHAAGPWEVKIHAHD